MPNTNIKERAEDLQRLLNKDRDRVGKETAYGNMLDKLSALVKQTDKMYEKDTDGREKPMGGNDYIQLMKNYQELQAACENCFREGAATSKLEKNRLYVVNRLQSYIKKDMEFLDGLDPKKLPTISDAIKDARTIRVNLPDVPLEKVGGAQNTRIAMKSVKGVKGFFTEKSGLDVNKEFEQILNNEVPKNQQAAFQKLFKTGSNRRDFLRHTLAIDAYDSLDPTRKKEYLRNLYAAASGKRVVPEQELGDTLLNLAKKSYVIANRDKNAKDAEIVSRERLDQRNCAMTRMADLLGCPKAVAKAVPMVVVTKGKTVEGTFMEKAEGLDLNRMTREQKNLRYDEDSMMTPEAMKQIADLNIVDYVCGNIDRHHENMLYQFKEVNGKQQLIGITGIDNDTSFGTVAPKNESRYMTPINNIKAISSGQAQHLLTLNQDIIKTALKEFQLDDKEIEAVWTRTKALQDRVKEGKIKTIANGEWEKQKWEELSDDRNLFACVAEVPAKIRKAVPMKENQPLKFADATRAEGGLNMLDLKEQQNQFLTLAEGIRKADDNLYINSGEFKKMRNAVYRMEEFYKSLQEKYPKGDTQIAPEDQKSLRELNSALKQASQEYINDKKITPKTDHGKLRLNLANELRDLSASVSDMLPPEKEAPEINVPEDSMSL